MSTTINQLASVAAGSALGMLAPVGAVGAVPSDVLFVDSFDEETRRCRRRSR